MSNFRAVLIFVLVGALLGIVIGTLSAETILTNGLCGFSNDVQINRPCLDTVRQATSGLIRYQLYGGLSGTVLGIAAGVFFSLRRKKKKSLDAPSEPVDAPKP
jgi:hypothetical protein